MNPEKPNGGNIVEMRHKVEALADEVELSRWDDIERRVGNQCTPMIADFAAEIAAGHVVVIEIPRAVEGYLISWPKMEAYFIDNIAVDPARQGLGMLCAK